MLGRRPQRPDEADTRLPPSRDDRVPDGPVTFTATSVQGGSRRGGLTLAVLGLGFVGLIGLGVAGRPAQTFTADASVTPVPSGVGSAAASGTTPGPVASLLVLTSPSHDEALVVGHLAVVGFVRGESRDVSLLLGEGERVMGSYQLLTTAKAGDPAFQARAWFESTFGIEMFPMGRPLWVEVGVVRDDGGIDRVRRSFRRGPIIEPDEK